MTSSQPIAGQRATAREIEAVSFSHSPADEPSDYQQFAAPAGSDADQQFSAPFFGPPVTESDDDSDNAPALPPVTPVRRSGRRTEGGARSGESPRTSRRYHL
jgi:hypothetical protein